MNADEPVTAEEEEMGEMVAIRCHQCGRKLMEVHNGASYRTVCPRCKADCRG